MGQKVGGYRRNVPYGQETSLLSGGLGKNGNGWIFDVNPKGRVGWNRGTSGRKEKEYGKSLSEGRRLRKELEEVRRASGCESNGLGRKGTKESGYVVYGEYTRGNRERSKGKRGKEGVAKTKDGVERTPGSMSSKVREKGDLLVSMERVLINYEKKRQAKVERKRTNLKERRRQKGLVRDMKERRKVLGYSSKRRKGEERCEAIALSGRMPTGKRRTNLIVRELENGLNHREVLRKRESLRKHHAKSSQRGRKRLGESDRRSSKNEGERSGGYYGLKVCVKGPLEGARRTLVYGIQLGTVPRGTKQARMTRTHEHAKTNVGTVGVQVTYCYGRG